MLRYLAYGPKDLASSPVLVTTRFNWEFYANLDGFLRPTLQGEKPLPFSKPRLWLFAPETFHGWQAQTPVERVVLHFSSVPGIVSECCGDAGYIEAPLTPSDVTYLRELAHSLEKHYRSPTPASLLLFQRALIDLSLILLRDRELNSNLPLETVAVERVERAVEWYVSRLAQRPTLAALAEVVHVSQAHLRRQFKLVYGKSPHAVLTQLRLEKAAQLLATTTDKLEVIAKQSGFNSASDFCRVFHRRFKVYPNVWRTYLSGIEQEERDKQIARLLARTAGATGEGSAMATPSTMPEPTAATLGFRPATTTPTLPLPPKKRRTRRARPGVARTS